MQDTVVGLINLEQNNIMKVFTLIIVLLMPATLIASFYGMNVELPFANFKLAWVGILALMVIILLVVVFIFRRKKFF